MSTIDAIDRQTSGPAARHALPDPGDAPLAPPRQGNAV